MSCNYFPVEEFKARKWNDYDLVMPAVAIGNVGQLSVDLLISSLPVKLIGRYQHPAILPLAGSDPFDPESTTIATACQIYLCENAKLVIFQQRSPVAPYGRSLYCKQIGEWIKSQQFKRTIILSSACGIFLTDKNMTNKLQFLSSTDMDDKFGRTFLEFGWKRVIDLTEDGCKDIPYMPGSGLTRMIFRECEAQGLSTAVLIWFCSEGDNIPDALELANNLNKWLNILPSDSCKQLWKLPYSWNLLYGNGPPPSIF